tara:strand:- start:658 stop:1161 length:504 start_codon:yes stop_codon:yes gene_type:complete
MRYTFVSALGSDEPLAVEVFMRIAYTPVTSTAVVVPGALLVSVVAVSKKFSPSAEYWSLAIPLPIDRDASGSGIRCSSACRYRAMRTGAETPASSVRFILISAVFPKLNNPVQKLLTLAAAAAFLLKSSEWGLVNRDSHSISKTLYLRMLAVLARLAKLNRHFVNPV